MTHLFIDDVMVDLPTDFKFTLVCENPYFTRSGSYSLDVTLSTLSAVNSRLFRHISRIDVSKRLMTWSCRLVVDNKNVLIGTATLTEVNEDSVTVQLLGGNSEMNFLSRVNELYIDEIDLGYINDTWFIIGSENLIPNVRDSKHNLEKRSDGKWYYNGQLIEELHGLSFGFVPRFNSYDIVTDTLYRVDDPQNFMLHPYVRTVVQNLFYIHFGYFVDASEINGTLYQNLCCANFHRNEYMNSMMPHWTVSDFLEQFELFFNCRFILDDKTKIAKIKSFSNEKFSSKTIFIDKVLSEFSAQIELDSEENSDVSNVWNPEYELSYSDFGYEFLSDDFRELIIDVGEVNYVPTSLLEKYGATRLYAFRKNGIIKDIWSIKDSSGIIPPISGIDLYGRFDPTKEKTHTLKIKPASYITLSDHRSYIIGNILSKSNDEDLYDLLQSNSELTPKEYLNDFLVVLNGETGYESLTHKPPYASLSMHFTESSISNVSSSMSSYHSDFISYDKSVIYEITFVFSEFFDPTAMFIISNKKYACLKFEYEINSLGFLPIVKGQFYRIGQ